MEIGKHIACVKDLRQGDVIELEWIPTIIDGEPAKFFTPGGVVIVSQTCDVVQESSGKKNVIVAPLVEDPTKSQFSLARSGATPLSVYLPEFADCLGAIADMQHATAIPKQIMIGKTLTARHTDGDSSVSALNLSQRIGRVYSRFAFPDEVVLVLNKMKKKARKAAQGSGSFGHVLDHLDFRVKANHWNEPGRKIYFYIIVDASLLIVAEDVDPDWSWATAKVVGLKQQEQPDSVNFTRLSELLADTCASYLDDKTTSDGTTLLYLWGAWALKFKVELLDSQINEEVSEFQVELLSDDEFTLSQWRRTASLDLEDLTDSKNATDRDDD